MHATLNTRSLFRFRRVNSSDPQKISGQPSPSQAAAAPAAPEVMPSRNIKAKKPPLPTSSGHAIVLLRANKEVSRLAVSKTGTTFSLPHRNISIHLRTMGVVALAVIVCLGVAGASLSSSTPASAGLPSAVSGGFKNAFASVGTFFTGFYTRYRAPILRRGVIYDDSLKNSWVVKAPSQQISLNASSQMFGAYHSQRAIRVRLEGLPDALRLKVPPAHGIELDNYTQLVFATNGGMMGNQKISLRAEVDGKIQKTVALDAPAIGKWSTVKLPLSTLTGNKGRLTGITIFAEKPQPVFYLDDLHLE